jgi:hypothetical protein
MKKREVVIRAVLFDSIILGVTIPGLFGNFPLKSGYCVLFALLVCCLGAMNYLVIKK